MCTKTYRQKWVSHLKFQGSVSSMSYPDTDVKTCQGYASNSNCNINTSWSHLGAWESNVDLGVASLSVSPKQSRKMLGNIVPIYLLTVGGRTSCVSQHFQSVRCRKDAGQWYSISTHRWVAEVLIKCRVEVISIEVPHVVFWQTDLIGVTCGIK